jgi:hypothetical protein
MEPLREARAVAACAASTNRTKILRFGLSGLDRRQHRARGRHAAARRKGAFWPEVDRPDRSNDVR